MSTKHRNYPVLPELSIQLPDGRKERIKAVLCAEDAAEFQLTLSLGVDGDLITHHYTLGLGRLLQSFEVHPDAICKIRNEYADRVRGRIMLDAILNGTDLWLREGTFFFPMCVALKIEEQEEMWKKMLSGKVRPDALHIVLEGETKAKETPVDTNGG